MTLFALLITLAAPASAAKIPDPAEEAFKTAKAARTDLKADEKKMKFRHHWQNVGKKLEAFAGKYPKSPRAAEALLLAAKTYEELSKISQNQEDAEAARRLYARAK